MWIATNRGFLSIVTADPKRLPKAEKQLVQPLCVRARNADHLKTLFPNKLVYEWKGRDYPARIFIAAAELGALMAMEVAAIDYPNFKSSVKDDELHDAYMGVWSVMHGYQMGRYKRGPRAYDPRQASFYDRDYGAPFNEQVPDDDACTTPGCTEYNPCLDCILDAMAEGRGQNEDGSLADRAGDFDSGDERDDDDAANSANRVPPR